MSPHKLYLAHFSIHGLLRGQNPELGRDADTGGQIRYVVELAKELGNQIFDDCKKFRMSFMVIMRMRVMLGVY